LPPGLTLTSSTGVISGTPTTATGSPFNFTVQAADSGTPQQTATQALSISIATAPLSVATTGLPNGIQGQAYSATLQSAGGNPPVTWSISVGSLPSWASLNTSTGAITGTPNATGTTSFTVKATDSTTPTAQTATKSFSITVVNALSITTTSLPAGTVGSPYNTTVAATGGTTPYTWSWAAQAGSSLPPGLSINSSTGVISGTPSTNTGSPFNVTVTVADSATNPQQNASANFSITITVATLTVTTTSSQLPNGTVNTAYPNNVNLSASGGIPPYTWLQTGGTLPPGLSLSTSGVISGTPTTATGSPFSFTVQVTDSATNTATATLSITVNAAPSCASGGSESLLSGGYAMLLKGFDSAGNPALVGGVLTFNGTNNSGSITAGTLDMNLNSGVQTNLTVTSGSYGIGSDHRGCMVITTSAGTQNYRFSLGNLSGTPAVASTGHVIGFDTTGPFTAGVLRKQSGSFSTSVVTGSFAFGGWSIQNTALCQNAICGGKFGVVGLITFNGSGGITSGSEDINQNGVLEGNPTLTTWPATSPISFTSTGSSYSLAANGRGSLTVAIAGSPSIFHSLLYAVSSTDALFMTSDPQTTANISAGEALKQSGTFSANPLSGSYVGYDSGIGSGGAGTARTDIILLGPLTSGSSTLTGTQQRNDAGVFSSGAISGTYSVSPTGRLLVSGGGGHEPILYLVSTSQAFFLNGNGGVDSGFFQSQSGGPFGSSSASGTYAFGTIDPEDSSGSDESGVATFTSPNINGTSDDNSNGSQSLANSFTSTYSVDSTGLIHLPTGCTVSAASTTCQTLIYIISPTKAVVMDTTSSNPRIQVADK
jgi:Putative Ig domain